MYKIFFLFLLLISLGSTSAQKFIGKLNPDPTRSIQQFTDSLNILAVMVNFQTDRDAATFGNGKFGTIYSKDYGTSILDPLPHDKAYFESHLEFAKNYFNKVSRGKLNISYTVLPDTFSVSQTMRNYSPQNNSDDFTALGNFASEVWSIAGNLYPDFNFADYDVFLIFHAGVGRDISLPGSLGTERDLPSVYLGLNSLKKIFGDGFSGFPVSDNTFFITNSLIIPETESRELESIGGSVLFEISINGLIAASIASHLGLPDLFDTETGLSAIGRFGLMDGQAIFAYNGTFPPEPSAWEKIFLGWETPVTVSPGNYITSLTAGLIAGLTDTTILKIPINSSEYFLVENRQRDLLTPGAELTYNLNGIIRTKTFLKDTTGFLSFDTDSLEGVVTNVDEFDWALPGSGILIWHIDENIINSKISENRINADKNNRGVDVEEADGIQEIGEQFTTIFGDVLVGEGIQEDMWYSSNGARFFTNRFSKDTRPNSNSNSDANSLITLSDFSDISGKMFFRISYGDSVIQPIVSEKISVPVNKNKLTAFQRNDSSFFALISGSNLSIINSDGIIENSYINFSEFKPASNGNFLAGASGTNLNVYPSFVSVNVGEMITAPPVIQLNTSGNHILVGTENGNIYFYSLSDNPVRNDNLTFSSDTSFTIKKISVIDNYFSFIAENNIEGRLLDSERNSFSFTNEKPVSLALTKDRSGKNINIVLTDQNNFYIFNKTELIKTIEIKSSDLISDFSLSDLKKDGENYIIFTDGERLNAINLTGASAENFPFDDPLNIGFTGLPLTADFEGDNNSEVIISTKDGRIFAIDGRSANIVNGFPFSSGAELAAVPVIFSNNGKASIAFFNDSSYFSSYQIGLTEGTLYWSEENGNSSNASSAGAAKNDNFISDFFPSERAYNYPNPVYEGETKIHYFVSENSKINIKIFDLAGDFVAELNDEAAGGFDNETIWNVNDIQSGVYLARIEAVGSSGKTETNIIKIAVVK